MPRPATNAAAAAAAITPHCNKGVTVDLTHLDFGDAGAITLAAALKESTVVEQLFITYNEIEEDGAAAICTDNMLDDAG